MKTKIRIESLEATRKEKKGQHLNRGGRQHQVGRLVNLALPSCKH